MKKLLFLVLSIFGIMGCNSQGVVSPYNLKQALDIVYNETKDMKITGYGGSLEYRAMFLQDYLKDRKYHNNMECGILDMSDVQGTKHISACLLKNVHKNTSNTKDVSVLVMAEKSKNNSDIILLMFFDDAEKTEKGYKYSTIMPIDILVNLKTHKIGNP